MCAGFGATVLTIVPYGGIHFAVYGKCKALLEQWRAQRSHAGEPTPNPPLPSASKSLDKVLAG
jgi:hypothetical protein